MKTILIVNFSILINLFCFSQTPENGGFTEKTKKEPSFINLLTVQGLVGKHLRGWGVNYTGFSYKPTGSFFTGFSLGYESATFATTDENLNIRINSAQLGLRFMGKLSQQFYVNIGIMALFGKEKIERTINLPSGGFVPSSSPISQIEKNTVLGFAPSQGIFFVPKEKAGVTVGLSFYQRLFNSEYYRYDIGGMLSVGLKL